jgi:4-amino-4-deoxy-L-arabinose transferase-like glycosyltransferase
MALAAPAEDERPVPDRWYRREAAGAALSVLVLAAAWAVMFLPRIASFPLNAGDEARLAVNAAEMVLHGNPLVTHYDGVPELANTKPPLLIWLMALLLNVFGEPLWAVRLPSALACLGTLLAVWRFSRTELGDNAGGLLAGMVLLTSWGFTGGHTGGTGDYDALLVFFTTSSLLAFARFADGTEPRSRGVVALSAVAAVLAVLTKGIAGMMPLPAALIYAVLRRRLGFVIRDRFLWIAAAAAGLALLGFFALREAASPGYLSALTHNDVAGLAAGEIFPDYTAPRFYYLIFITSLVLSPWFLPLPILIYFTLRRGTPAQRRGLLLSLCVALWVYAVVESLGVKFYWYFAPAMPFVALAAGTGLSAVRGLAPVAARPAVDIVLAALLGAALLIDRAQPVMPPFMRYKPPHDRQLFYGALLPALRPIEPGKTLLVADAGLETMSRFPHYNPIALFYVEIEQLRGRDARVLAPGEVPPAGSPVASCDAASIAWLKSSFETRTVADDGNCLAVIVLAAKPGAEAGAPAASGGPEPAQP